MTNTTKQSPRFTTRHPSFETRPSDAPQDERLTDRNSAPSTPFVPRLPPFVLRSERSERLEGRAAFVPRLPPFVLRSERSERLEGRAPFVPRLPPFVLRSERSERLEGRAPRTHLATIVAIALLLGSASTARAEADPEPQTIEDPANPTIPTRAVVRHVPPQEARGDRELRLIAVIEDAWVAGQLVARYRRLGERDYREAPFSRSSAGGYFALIPPQDIGRPGIEYYIVGDANPDKPHFASPERPHVVRVETSRDQLWQEIERNRLHGKTYAFGARMEFQDFGATHGEDRYIRSEVDFQYRLVRRLYSIRIGYGLFEGVTPSDIGDMPTSLDRSVHYGFGGARLRLRDSIWLDGRAIIGFGEKGFAPGVGASLMIGDEWRTAVTVGGEYIDELSYKAFITLQWDTVPGVLMAATAATTDQPSSNIDAGSFVKFEVKKPFGGLHLAGHVSFGARGNRPGGFGGGLSTEYRF